MPNALNALLQISSANKKPIALIQPVDFVAEQPDLAMLLAQAAGGFTVFDNALCVYAGQANTGSGIFDVQYWNTKAGWKAFYGDLLDDVWFFAEDAFGSQFGFADDVIVRFEPETAEITLHSESLSAWAERIMSDTAYETGAVLAAEWAAEHGPLPAGHRLLPLLPFAVGGDYSAANLEPIAKKQAMEKYAWLAQRLLETDDGAELELTGW